MKQITLTFTEQELHELACQLYLAGYFLNAKKYPTRAIAIALEEKVCTAGFNEFNDNGNYEPGMHDEALYRLSLQQSRKLDPFVEAYKKYVIADYLADELADRDIEEKHGPLENINFQEQPQLLLKRRDLLFEYGKELHANGVRNLRLIKTDNN